MSSDPDSLIFRLLREMRAELGDVRERMATKDDVAEVRSEMNSLRADVASDLVALEARQNELHRQTREQIVGLRRAVIEYHTVVIGHGVLISDLDARLRRVEDHLGLTATDGA